MSERNPIPAVAVLAAFLVSVAASPFLASLELRSYDARLGLRREAGWPKDLVMMAIDRSTLEPAAMAALLEELEAAGAKTIAIDAMIVEPADSSAEGRLLDALRKVVLPVTIAPAALEEPRPLAPALVRGAPEGPRMDPDRLLMPAYGRQQHAIGMGHTAATPDRDGVFRRTDPFLIVDAEENLGIPSLPLVALAAHRGRDVTSYGGGRRLLDLTRGSAPRQVVAGSRDVAGALVVVHLPGEDSLPSPLSDATPGGLLFAAAVRTFDLGHSPRVIGALWPAVLLFAIGIGLALFLGRQPRAKRALAFVSLAAVWILVACAAVAILDVFLPVAWPLAFLVMAGIAAALPATR